MLERGCGGMAETSKSKRRVKRKEAEAVETEPDAWERFTKATRKVAPPKRPKPAQDRSSESGN